VKKKTEAKKASNDLNIEFLSLLANPTADAEKLKSIMAGNEGQVQMIYGKFKIHRKIQGRKFLNTEHKYPRHRKSKEESFAIASHV